MVIKPTKLDFFVVDPQHFRGPGQWSWCIFVCLSTLHETYFEGVPPSPPPLTEFFYVGKLTRVSGLPRSLLGLDNWAARRPPPIRLASFWPSKCINGRRALQLYRGLGGGLNVFDLIYDCLAFSFWQNQKGHFPLKQGLGRHKHFHIYSLDNL